MEREQVLVVQETEYTAAGKLPSSQLTFAKENGVEVKRGHPRDNIPGKAIVIPEEINQFRLEELDLDKIRKSYFSKAVETTKPYEPTQEDFLFLAEDSNSSIDYVLGVIQTSISN